MKIFLVGYMCSGKSTLGPQLAVKLGVPFFDLDKEIERIEGRSPGNIILEEGEDHFRMLEKKSLTVLTKSNADFVMATGGGTPCYFNNMDVMKKNGVTLYLTVGVKELVRRNLHSSELRPLLRGLNELEMQAFITEHLKQRLPYYKKASVTLKENEMDLERIVQEVKLMSHSR